MGRFPFFSGVHMNLLRLNIWRKILIGLFVLSIVLMFGLDWGYHFHIGHVVRIFVGLAAVWIAVDRL